MRHALSVRVEVRKAGWIYRLDAWHGRPDLGKCLPLADSDAVGVVVQMLVNGEHARFAIGYVGDG